MCYFDGNPDYPKALHQKLITFDIPGIAEFPEYEKFPEISSDDARIEWKVDIGDKFKTGDHIGSISPFCYGCNKQSIDAEAEFVTDSVGIEHDHMLTYRCHKILPH